MNLKLQVPTITKVKGEHAMGHSGALDPPKFQNLFFF